MRPSETSGHLPSGPATPAVHATRRPWLVFATSGPAIAAAAEVGPDKVLVVARRDAFDAAFEREAPELIIVSVPPARPSDLASLVAARRRRPGLMLVLLDAPASTEERLAALRAGFDEALPASIATTELLGRIRLLLDRGRRGTRSRPRGCRVGPGVFLDPIAHEIWKDGARVRVRPKEFALLAWLAAHPGRAFTRAQLLEHVWGTDRRGGPRTVDVHIRWLRAKIEPDPSRPEHLVTVRGVGYRLDPSALTEP